MTSSTMITISVFLTKADRQQAQAFKDLQSNPAKANQVYENTLAVLATHRYLTMIDIPTDLENSYSQNPIAFLSANVTDLYVPEARGRLECRAVRAGDNTCFIPEEVWKGSNRGDRIGYVVVQLNETNTEATVLGFVPEVSVERLPLECLQSLDDLIVAIGSHEPWAPEDEARETVSNTNHKDRSANNIVPTRGLSQRLKEQSNKSDEEIVYDSGWQSPKTLIESYRGTTVRSASDSQNLIPLLEEAKVLDLGQETASEVILLRRITQRDIEEDTFDLSIILSSTSASMLLPLGLEVTVHDAKTGALFFHEKSKHDSSIELPIANCHPSEHYIVKVTLGDESVTEEVRV